MTTHSTQGERIANRICIGVVLLLVVIGVVAGTVALVRHSMRPTVELDQEIYVEFWA